MIRNEYFSKYLGGTATQEERALVIAWVTGLMERVATGIASKEEEEIVTYWLNRDPKMFSDPGEIEMRKKETKTILDQQFFTETRREKPPAFYRYAAAAAILLMLGFGIFLIHRSNKKNTTATFQFPTASHIVNSVITYQTDAQPLIKKIPLPDSSFIFLNANASLSIDSAHFNLRTREVILNNGEAFFQVAKNRDKKFYVRFGNLQLEVIGTSFNIENDEIKTEKRVYVKTGRVLIKDKEKVIATLTPDETFIYNDQTKLYTVSKDPATDLSQWIEGKLVFAGADWNDIKQKMKINFGVDLLIENNALPTSLQLNAVFNEEDDVLKIVRVIAGIYGSRFRTEPGKIIFYK